MKDPGRKTILWVIVTLLLAMSPQLLSMPLPVTLIALAPLAWRFGSEWSGWKPLPAWVRHSATAAGLVILFVSYGNLAGRRAAVSLLAVMLSLKMIECYRIRDARLVVSFSLFLCATQFLFTQSILMPFYGGMTVVLALVSLAQLQRTEAWSHEGAAPAVRASIISELGFSLRLLALAVPIGMALFILFPRLATPLWGIPDTTLDSKTGLSDSMSPGSIQDLFMDDSPAFRVEFSGAVPSAEQLYWRGPVFWRFDGRTWTGSFYGKNIEAKAVPDLLGKTWEYTVQLEPNERNWLFALDYPATVPPDTRLTTDYQLIRRHPVIQLTHYGVVSNPDFIDAPDLPTPLRMQALDLPDGSNPRTQQLVRQWRQETPGDKAFIQRVLQHFNQEPFHYSLNAPFLGFHSVDDFLFDSRTGFCEHYASSFAVMMRMAGIPARIVTGYQGGWFSDLGNYLLVRQSDAHAWTEVWLRGEGWTRVDPTAAVSPQRVERGSLGALGSPRHVLDYGWIRGVRNSADIVQQRWNDWIIEYGAGQQAQLLAPLGLGHMTPSMLVGVLFFVILIVSAIIFPIVMRIRGPASKDPVQKIWQKFLKRLLSAGYESRASDGAMELARSASVVLPAVSGHIHDIADLYTRSRYASDPPPLSQLKQAVQAFRPNKKRG
jgi:transglutaminase-like putative cysteine protease